jgi:hypothetical protein
MRHHPCHSLALVHNVVVRLELVTVGRSQQKTLIISGVNELLLGCHTTTAHMYVRQHPDQVIRVPLIGQRVAR